jgi:ribosomal protein S27E
LSKKKSKKDKKKGSEIEKQVSIDDFVQSVYPDILQELNPVQWAFLATKEEHDRLEEMIMRGKKYGNETERYFKIETFRRGIERRDQKATVIRTWLKLGGIATERLIEAKTAIRRGSVNEILCDCVNIGAMKRELLKDLAEPDALEGLSINAINSFVYYMDASIYLLPELITKIASYTETDSTLQKKRKFFKVECPNCGIKLNKKYNKTICQICKKSTGQNYVFKPIYLDGGKTDGKSKLLETSIPSTEERKYFEVKCPMCGASGPKDLEGMKCDPCSSKAGKTIRFEPYYSD